MRLIKSSSQSIPSGTLAASPRTSQRIPSSFLGRAREGSLSRRGISLVEVMVSIVVALIGVFGVFMLIPFAVRQIEIGMNEEAAQTLARNALHDFDAQGFQNTARWAWPEMTAAGPPFYQAITPPPAPVAPAIVSRQVFCIDPWGWSQQGLDPSVADPFSLAPTAFASFPYFNSAGPAVPTFPRLSLFDSSGNVFSRGFARRLFSGHDDLIAQAATDDFSGPTQQFFTPNGGRQYAGRLTWQMFVVQDYAAEGFSRFYSVVSLRRVSNNQDRVFTLPAGVTTISRGDDVVLTEVARTPPPDTTGIRRGSWLMIVEQSSTGAINDIAFYRVLESDEDAGNVTVTLQGSDLTAQTLPSPSTFYAVLIPDVIAVYERTMKYESSSDWNLN